MSRDELVELRDYIDITLGARSAMVTERQKTMIRQRAAQMADDPTLGATWEEVCADLMADVR